MRTPRRDFLAAVGATLGGLAVAGCSALSGTPSADEPPPPPEDLPSPADHIYGATGTWSSVGANAANNRVVADGAVPTSAVTERWRVQINPMDEPIVVDGQVYVVGANGGLLTLDAESGNRLWSAPGGRAPPLVRDGTAYAPTRTALLAFDADTGEQLWERSLTDDDEGLVTSPATKEGETVYCGAGERVVALDARDGTVRWERSVFGQTVGPPLIFVGVQAGGLVVATRAGEVYWLTRGGGGVWRWDLPGVPRDPPTADRDRLYVTCWPGTTYALPFGEGQRRLWSSETGASLPRAAVDEGHELLFVAGGRHLHAVDSESGERRWQHDIGDFGLSAPVYGRDTVLVGGDRLRALDPTPGGDPAGGPAVRYEVDVDQYVGPGPVIEDGRVYVGTRSDDGPPALVALD